MTTLADGPNETGMTADVNADVTFTLFNRDGEAVRVSAEKVAYWLKLGFSPKPQDLESLANEVRALALAVDDPWVAYAEACQATGFIDTKAQDVAIHALQLLSEACNNLHLALHQAYRVKGEDE